MIFVMPAEGERDDVAVKQISRGFEHDLLALGGHHAESIPCQGSQNGDYDDQTCDIADMAAQHIRTADAVDEGEHQAGQLRACSAQNRVDRKGDDPGIDEVKKGGEPGEEDAEDKEMLGAFDKTQEQAHMCWITLFHNAPPHRLPDAASSMATSAYCLVKSSQ